MSHRLRVTLILLGALLILLSLAALSYALGPVTDLHEQVTLAPTLFSPP
jgi:hypothetical protein